MRRVRLCRAKCAPVHPVSAVHWHMFVNEGLPGWASHQRGGASSQLTTRLCWQRPASERGWPPQLQPLPGWRLPAPRWSCTVSCWKWPLQWSALCGRTQKQTNCLLSVHSPSKSMHSPLLHIEHTMQTNAAQAAPPKQKMALALTVIVVSPALRIRQVYVIERNFPKWRHLGMFYAFIDKRCQLTVQDWRCCVCPRESPQPWLHSCGSQFCQCSSLDEAF